MESDRALLSLKLEQIGRESIEEQKFQPPVTVFCVDPDGDISVRAAEVELMVDADGALFLAAVRDSNLALPPRLDVWITDANKRRVKVGSVSRPF